jgi:hypothetical protein
LVGAAGGCQWMGGGIGELSQAGAEQTVVGAGEEEGVVEAGVGELVAVAVRDAGDQAVGSEPAQVAGRLPGDMGLSSSCLTRSRRSRLVNPFGRSRKTRSAQSSAWARVSAKRSPAMWAPFSVITGSLTAVKVSRPAAGSWLSCWTPSRRRLAVKPTSQSAGRLDVSRCRSHGCR